MYSLEFITTMKLCNHILFKHEIRPLCLLLTEQKLCTTEEKKREDKFDLNLLFKVNRIENKSKINRKYPTVPETS